MADHCRHSPSGPQAPFVVRMTDIALCELTKINGFGRLWPIMFFFRQSWGAVMSALRAPWWLSLVAAVIALCAPISSARSQQRVPEFFGIFGAIINSAIVDSARREWQSRPVADYNCLASRNLSADQLAANGIGPNDPRIRRLLYECAHARRYAPEPQKAVTLAVGPYNPNFVVDGLALGGTVYPDSAVYKSYSCRPSDDFTGFTWCTVHHTELRQVWAIHLFGDHSAFQLQ